MSQTQLEIERKFRISAETAEKLPKMLSDRGFKSIGRSVMADAFLPVEKEGDMLRLRRDQICQEGDGTCERLFLTSKQWQEFPGGGKERKETEEEISTLAFSSLMSLGERLAGPLSGFSKIRVSYAGKVDGFDCIVSIDEASGLGSYSGHYVELEILAENEKHLQEIRSSIFKTAEDLLGGEAKQEQMSYMEMLKRSQARL